MQLQEIVGQLFCVGFEGTDLDANPRLRSHIENGMVGSVIIYKRNLGEDLSRLLKQLHEVETEHPLWIMVDQEGGRTQRVRDVDTLSHFDMARSHTPEEAKDAYRKMAAMLRGLGFNFNLAPVVDLDINPANPIIGYYGRSFSHDPEIVYTYARAFIEAHREEGVLTCIKHYPGHGSATMDTHLHWANVTALWKPAEREIFKRMIDDRYADSLMTSHVFHREIDDKFPASLSRKHVRDIVRDRWNFDGLILSDDLLMNAVSKHYDLPEILEYAVSAGNDVLIFSNVDYFAGDYVGNLHRIVRDLVEKGRISMTDLEESFNRVIGLKRKCS